MAITYVILALTALFTVVWGAGTSKLKISQGEVFGRYLQTESGQNHYYSYTKIPYAKPPVKELRFQPPEAHPGWKGVLKAMDYDSKKDSCPQEEDLTGESLGREDCLYVNVYTPKLKKDFENGDKLKSVMFWIHPGMFKYGSASPSIYGPDNFMDEENVVLVTVQYRLGVLGFLDLEDESMSDNNGLRDMVMALEWVKENVEHFGGNPNSVTIFGNGAGGVAVDLLLLTKHAKGLFHKAICQSGVALNGMLLDWSPKKRAYKLAEKLNFKPHSSKEVITALRESDPWALATNASGLIDVDETLIRQIGVMAFTPSINTKNKDAFLTEFPEKIYSEDRHPNKDIPVMIGFTSQESILSSKYFVQRPFFLKQVEKQFSYLWPMRDLYSKFKSHYYFEVAYRIKYFYFPNGTIDYNKETALDEYLSMMSDLQIYPIDRTVRAYANSNSAPVYYYRFSFDGDFNHYKIDATTPIFKDVNVKVKGASERDEICYLFKCDEFNLPYKKAFAGDERYGKSAKMIRKMVRLWTNFANYGNPTPNPDDELLDKVSWTPVSKEKRHFLDIDDTLTVGEDPHKENVEFWDNMYEYYTPLSQNGVLYDQKDEL